MIIQKKTEKSLKEISLKFTTQGFSHIKKIKTCDKINSLGSYYGAEIRKEKASETSGVGTFYVSSVPGGIFMI